MITAGLFWLSGSMYAQSSTGSNHCTIRIATLTKTYEFTSDSMEARLNDALERFEFKIPFRSITSSRDPDDLAVISRIAGGSDFIVVNAALPEDGDEALDLTRFRGTKTFGLAGEVRIGTHTFEEVIAFNGLLIGLDRNSLAFAMNASLDERTLTPLSTSGEPIIEIQIAVKGDKIIMLTTNQ